MAGIPYVRGTIVLLGAALTIGCGLSSEYTVQGTERSVGVDGVIEITRKVEDVNVVNVALVNLPPPERHQQGLKAFVVWLTPEDGEPIRAGRLRYDPGARRGSLRVTTPNDQVFVQVTAERSSRVPAPGDFVVISSHVALRGAASASVADSER